MRRPVASAPAAATPHNCQEYIDRIGQLERALADARAALEQQPEPPVVATVVDQVPPVQQQPQGDPCAELRLRLAAAEDALAKAKQRERDFVKVQVPSRELEALQRAMDEYVRRNPGAEPAIKTIEAYAKQYVSGQ